MQRGMADLQDVIEWLLFARLRQSPFFYVMQGGTWYRNGLTEG